MKYWRRDNVCGIRDNNGFVPDSIEITEEEYNNYVKNLIISTPPKQKTDIERLVIYAKEQKWI